MPNPRITFRCPEHLYSRLPEDERERSQLLLRLLEQHYDPSDLAAQIERHEQRITALEERLKNHSAYLIR
jgi:hypothetical protein